MEKQGKIFVLSGPSGVGKGTLLKMLCEDFPEIRLSISYTTRRPRFNETAEVDYHFVNQDIFMEMIKNGEFLEWAEFAGNYYGTSIKNLQDTLGEGKNIFLEIDVKGAVQVKEKIDKAVLIFISPPSIEVLKTRLFKRKTDSPQAIENRLALVKSELEKKILFDYEIINDDLSKAYKMLKNIITKELNNKV
jgi:guanylate kinase